MTRYVGVAVALVGVAVAAPDAVRMLFANGKTRAARGSRWARAGLARVGWLVRLFPWLRPTITGVMAGSVAAATAFGTATVTQRKWEWRQDATLDEKLAVIVERLDHLDKRIELLDGRINDERNERTQAIDRLRQELTGQLQHFTDRLEQHERDETQVDYHGLFVLAAGVVLTGIPDEIVSLPLYLGAVVPLGVAVAASWQARKAFWVGRQVASTPTSRSG